MKTTDTLARLSCCTIELVVMRRMTVCRSFNSSTPLFIKFHRVLITLSAVVYNSHPID